jgi:hypothetical protein
MTVSFGFRSSALSTEKLVGLSGLAPCFPPKWRLVADPHASHNGPHGDCAHGRSTASWS